MVVHGNYYVPVHYTGDHTIHNLVERIRLGKHAPDFIDHRFTDENFPQTKDGVENLIISVISFGRVIDSEEETGALIASEGYEIADPAELLSLRLEYPSFVWGDRIAAPKQAWKSTRGYRMIPCLNSGTGSGIRLRMIDAGWLEFWKFAVIKAESAQA